jgi:hypothetical protein
LVLVLVLVLLLLEQGVLQTLVDLLTKFQTLELRLVPVEVQLEVLEVHAE